MTFNSVMAGTTNLSNNPDNAWVMNSIASEGPSGKKRYEWTNSKVNEYRGFYKTIPELKRTIDIYAVRTIGQGFSADPETQVILDHIKGRGNQDFLEILWDMLVGMKVYGDSFAQIMRDEDSGAIVNMKVLDASTIKIISDQFGIIEGYEQMSKIPEDQKKTINKFKPEEIFHLSNDMIDDEVHGISVIESVRKIIEYRNQAMSDKARILHVSSIRIIEVDTDDETERKRLEKIYEVAVTKGEVMFVPKGSMTVPQIPEWKHESQEWIQYLENFFYQAVGVAKPITGGSDQFTESGSKVAMIAQETQDTWDGLRIEKDIWNQLFLKIKLNRPDSLMPEMQTDSMKDTGQMKPPTNPAGREE